MFVFSSIRENQRGHDRMIHAPRVHGPTEVWGQHEPAIKAEPGCRRMQISSLIQYIDFL